MAKAMRLQCRLSEITRVPAWHKEASGQWGARERVRLMLSGTGCAIVLHLAAEAAEAAGMTQLGAHYQVAIEPAPVSPPVAGQPVEPGGREEAA